MAAFHGCHTHLHTPSLPHTLHPFVHPAQSLGIDFESTRQRLLSLFDPERTPPSFQQPPFQASMAAVHGYYSPYGAPTTAFNCCHSPYATSMAAYHYPHSSSATEDRLEAALTKLEAVTRRLDAQLDALLLRLPRRPGPLLRTSLRPLPLSTPPPLTPLTPPPLPPPPPPATTPLPPPFASIQLQPIIPPRPTIFLAPHAKQEEHRAITLFGLRFGLFGSIMVSRKCSPAVLALRTGAELSEFCRHRPWDPGITLVVLVERITLRAR
ncbi:hypothetical protein HKD37_06G017311 [Glycine soja]